MYIYFDSLLISQNIIDKSREIRGGGDQSSFVAFGTDEETRPLVEGRTYEALKGN